MVETMRWEQGKLVLLDQTLLPNKIEWISCEDYLRVKLAIERLEVRGAPAIGAAAAFAMALGAREVADKPDFLGALDAVRVDLITARPTAVNLAWAANLQYELATKLNKDDLPPFKIIKALEAKAEQIYADDIAINKRMGEYGAEVLPDKAVVLTHCNAGALATCGWGTALGVIRSAYAQGKLQMVYADETRPLLQGARLTAFELYEDKIPVTLITDNMAAWTMRTKGINAVVVGADRIAANGDTANKIGTYGVALAAKAHGIPFYIAAPTSTFDFSISTGAQIPIEERQPDEVRRFRSEQTAPEGVEVFNPAFDVTPAELITGIITEYGVLRAPYVERIKELKDTLSTI
ncbi:S-methyl-5-thioribose-1-phosphate isomerase [Phascolarctobacterium succinatutens]|uniref:S-methyl-5-thioribose-1-phosphate isomerase n=1 Tax=Phascolarctobacterium succinatutens TaxID=626940 RepID=UPI0026EDEAAD|nr:S-methyl-5-thioribose-1-phosphate isomerase [Phascolarctobacterium succinatutens]